MKIGQYLAKIWVSGSGLLFFGPPCRLAASQVCTAVVRLAQPSVRPPWPRSNSSSGRLVTAAN